MRYFEIKLITSTVEIEENAKVKLRDYAYSGTILAVNNFMCTTMKNGTVFFVIREDSEELFSAAFSYDERKYSYNDAFQYLFNTLSDALSINRIKGEPCEVTMFQFYEYLQESKRRDFMSYNHRFIKEANLFYPDYHYDKPEKFCYVLEEKIVSDCSDKENCIYDKGFHKELSNINCHRNCSEFNGNMVHYVLSCRSFDAALDMTETLVQNLVNANRIKSKRIEIISNIEPDMYQKNNYIVDVIENNYGGTVVFDLTEKFGFGPVDYRMTSKYIESLVKKYKSECLFVFTYNMEQPGFSYFLLPELKKYIIPVFLREGSGGRPDAVKYLESLIKNSKYSVYAHQADEFLKQYPGSKFTQTEILQAYEQFES